MNDLEKLASYFEYLSQINPKNRRMLRYVATATRNLSTKQVRV